MGSPAHRNPKQPVSNALNRSSRQLVRISIAPLYAEPPRKTPRAPFFTLYQGPPSSGATANIGTILTIGIGFTIIGAEVVVIHPFQVASRHITQSVNGIPRRPGTDVPRCHVACIFSFYLLESLSGRIQVPIISPPFVLKTNHINLPLGFSGSTHRISATL